MRRMGLFIVCISVAGCSGGKSVQGVWKGDYFGGPATLTFAKDGTYSVDGNQASSGTFSQDSDQVNITAKVGRSPNLLIRWQGDKMEVRRDFPPSPAESEMIASGPAPDTAPAITLPPPPPPPKHPRPRIIVPKNR